MPKKIVYEKPLIFGHSLLLTKSACDPLGSSAGVGAQDSCTDGALATGATGCENGTSASSCLNGSVA